MHRVKFSFENKDRDGAVLERERTAAALLRVLWVFASLNCYDRSSRGVVGKASQRGRTQDPLYASRLNVC